jgi:hypothetical protein
LPAVQFDLVETDRIGWPPLGASEIWQCSPERLTRHFASERLGALMPDERSVAGAYPWVFFDPLTNHGALFVRDAADLPPWTAGSPFSLLFHLACAWRGWRLLHGASLGLDGRSMLLVGAGGIGKSATTLAGLHAGLTTVGDDYVILRPEMPPTSHAVYRIMKQSPAGLSRFPALQDALNRRPTNWHGKIEFDPEEFFPGCMSRSLALKALVLPIKADADATEFVPAEPAKIFSALATSVFSQLPGALMAGFSLLTRFTRQLPAYEARLSNDVSEIGGAMYRFLANGLP